jgi:hypothetical protein
MAGEQQMESYSRLSDAELKYVQQIRGPMGEFDVRLFEQARRANKLADELLDRQVPIGNGVRDALEQYLGK